MNTFERVSVNGLHMVLINGYHVPVDLAVLSQLYRQAHARLQECYHPEEGLTVSETGTYSQQLWARDAGAGGFGADPQMLWQTLNTFLSYQREGGEIPYRIERVDHVRRFRLKWTRRVGFDLTVRKQAEPIYRNSRYASAVCDTVPILVVTYAQSRKYHISLTADDVRVLSQLDNAVAHEEERFYDREFRLFNLPNVSDWMDDVSVSGYRTFTNLLWWRAYKVLGRFHQRASRQAKDDFTKDSHREKASLYRLKARVLYRSIKTNLMHPDGYLRAAADDERVDAASSVLHVIFSDGREEKLKTLTSLEHLRTRSGMLRNFDRGYSWYQYRFWFRVFGFTKFANSHVYPWLNHLELLGRIQVMDLSSEASVRETLSLVMKVAKVHNSNGDFHEVVTDTTAKPAIHRILGVKVYESTAGFLASVGTWIAAMDALAERLGVPPSELFAPSQPP